LQNRKEKAKHITQHNTGTKQNFSSFIHQELTSINKTLMQAIYLKTQNFKHFEI
jgi:hypothetical protein